MRTRFLTPRLLAAALAGLLVSVLPLLPASPAAAAGTNLALGKTATASSYTQTYAPNNVNDGNQATYWESNNNAFPQWAQVDLGSSHRRSTRSCCKLPTGWGARTETLSVQGSTDNASFSHHRRVDRLQLRRQRQHRHHQLHPDRPPGTCGSTSPRTPGWPAAQTLGVRDLRPDHHVGGANLALARRCRRAATRRRTRRATPTTATRRPTGRATNNAFPQWVQVDLGSSVSINKVVLKLPTGWGTRTETLSVGRAARTTPTSPRSWPRPATYSTVRRTRSRSRSRATTTRYVRLNFTANIGWPAGQISEFEVYGPTTGDTRHRPRRPNLAFTQPQSGQIKLTWNASTDNVGVTGYDIYLNNTLLTSVPASALTYTDNEPDTLTATYFVRAHDAAGNQSGNSNSVTRTGQTGDQTAPTAPGNLAVTTPTSGTVKLTWTASTDNVGVTSYVVYRNGAIDTTVSGTTLTYSESQPDTATVTYYVVAQGRGRQPVAAEQHRHAYRHRRRRRHQPRGRPADHRHREHVHLRADERQRQRPDHVLRGLVLPDPGNGQPARQRDAQLGRRQAEPGRVLGSPVPRPSRSSASPRAAARSSRWPRRQNYTFNPSTGNSVTIPVSGSYQNIELSITSNTGAPGGQVAEFQIFGTPAPNPDLTPTAISWTPTSPIETDAITVSTTVKNIGTAASAASNVNFYLGTTKVGTATVPGARRRRADRRHDEHRHPDRRHVRAHREGRRGEHARRAERHATTTSPARRTSS